MNPHLSVVIPAYNESAVLPETLACLGGYLAGQSYTAEVILVDDGSTDDTPAVAARFEEQFACLRVLRNPTNQGKGSSVRRGILESRGTYVLFTDADLPVRPEDIAKLLAPLEQGKAVAIASRLSADASGDTSRLRILASNLYRRLVRKTLRLPIQDTQCGFKAFVRESILPVADGLRERGYSFDAELLLGAWRRGLSIQEVDIHLIERREKVRHDILLRAPQMLYDLFRIQFRAAGNWRVCLAQTARFFLGFSDELFPNANDSSSGLS